MLKFATVLIFALAIIQYLQIGDALTEEERSSLKSKIDYLEEKSNSFQEKIVEAMNKLSTTVHAENRTVVDMRFAAVEIMKRHAISNGKNGKEATEKCIRVAKERLETVSNEFFEKFNKGFKGKKEHSPRIQQYKDVITEIRTVIQRFNAICNGDVTYVHESVIEDYNKIYKTIDNFKAKISKSGDRSIESKIATEVKASRIILHEKFEIIITEGMTCIDEA